MPRSSACAGIPQEGPCLQQQLLEAAVIQPDQAAHAVQGERGKEVGVTHQLESDRVLEVPVQPVAAVDGDPCVEQHEGEVLPLPLQDHAHAPGGRQVGEGGHDQADGDVPVGGLVIERADDEQGDAAGEGEELPGASIFNEEFGNYCFVGHGSPDLMDPPDGALPEFGSKRVGLGGNGSILSTVGAFAKLGAVLPSAMIVSGVGVEWRLPRLPSTQKNRQSSG